MQAEKVTGLVEIQTNSQHRTKETQRQTNSAKRAAGGDLDSCVDWVCAFFHPGNFKRTDGKHKAWAHPNQGVDEGILKPTSLISNTARGRAFVRCKRKDHKEEQILISTPTKHLGEMANSTLAPSKHLEAFDFQTSPHPCPQDYL